jgi:hypothetical protein
MTRVKYGSHIKATSIQRTRTVITESIIRFLLKIKIGISNIKSIKALANSPAANAEIPSTLPNCVGTCVKSIPDIVKPSLLSMI